jgi:hypothetical protein
MPCKLGFIWCYEVGKLGCMGGTGAVKLRKLFEYINKLLAAGGYFTRRVKNCFSGD